MPHRTQALALLLFAGGMLLVCLIRSAACPVQQDTHAGATANTYRIDPNTADAHTLCLLPRIGPGIAQRLIDDRETNGPFQNAADLTRVPMIGEKTVKALEPWVVLSSGE